MAKAPGTMRVDVVLDPSSLANSLRDLADKIDPQPPTATAEDLRGAEAEIERLNAIIDGRLEPSDATVEKVARVIARRSGISWTHAGPGLRTDFMHTARAVLAAIGGEQ